VVLPGLLSAFLFFEYFSPITRQDKDIPPLVMTPKNHQSISQSPWKI
jgi:hypothetical protein